MSLHVTNTDSICGMTARERLRCVLAERMCKKAVTSQATETTGAMQPSDNDLSKCSKAEASAPTKKRKLNMCKLKCSIISCHESFSKMQQAAETTGAMQPNDNDLSKCSKAEAPAPTKKRKLNRCELKCSIISCHESFSKMQQVIKHLNETHNQNLEVQLLKFSTEAEFDEWIHNVESSASCKFLRAGIKKWASAEHIYYYCSRSGNNRRIVTGPRKRRLKVQGYSKINRTCPAHIIKHVTHDEITINYYATHLCYSGTFEQLGHLRLSVADREWLAGKLALQIPLDAIMRDVRNTFDGQLTRLHLVTKKDLINIAQAFHLDKPEIHHEEGTTSVAASVRNDCLPIIAYNQQISGHFDIMPDGVERNIASQTNLVCDKLFERLTTICKGKYPRTKRLSELRKRHATSVTMQSMEVVVLSKEWHAQLESEETDYCADVDPSQIEFDDGIRLRKEREAAALVQQLSGQVRRLEERRKQLEGHLLEIIKSLTTLEEMDIVETTLCGIKAKLTAVHAKKIKTTLVQNSDRFKEHGYV